MLGSPVAEVSGWKAEEAGGLRGLVPKEFFKLLKTRNFQGPISLHEEYLDHRDPALVPKHWNAIKADLKTLQSLI